MTTRAETTRIVVANDGLGPNKGDQAILASMLGCLKEAIPGASVTVFPHSDMRRPGQYAAFCRALRTADVFLLGGGQSLQDQVSVAFLLSGLLKLVLARVLCKRVCCYGQGVGPLATRAGRFLTRVVLNRVDLVLVRDEDSLRRLRELGVTKPPCVLTGDPALALEPADPSRAIEILSREGVPETPGLRVAIAPRRWFHYGHYGLPMAYRARFCRLRGRERFARLARSVAEAADRLVTDYGAQVIFVPMRHARGTRDPGQDDDLVSAEIIRLMEHKACAFLIGGDYTPGELKALLGQMDLVVGMRLHSLLLAAMMQVPVIAIAVTPKFGPFLRMLGQGAHVLSAEQATCDALLTQAGDVLSRRQDIRKDLGARRLLVEQAARANEPHIRALLSRKG